MLLNLTTSAFVAAILAAGMGAATVPQTPAGDAPPHDVRADIHAQALDAIKADPTLSRNPFAVLVRFRPEASAPERAAARAAAAATTLHAYSIVPGLELVHTTLSPEAAIAILRTMPGVEDAEPDAVAEIFQESPPPQNIPSDPFFWYQLGFDNYGQNVTGGNPIVPGADINAPEAWSIHTGDPEFVVAMVDSGIEYTHVDLAANIWTNPGEIAGNGVDDDGNGYVDDVHGWDFYGQDADPMDENGHGTHTAGTVGAAGNNGVGVSGVMWQCRIVPLRFTGPDGNGLVSDAVLAIEYAVAESIRVSNHSWGTGSNSSSLHSAINAARSAGHIVVAAAGNFAKNIDKQSGARYPASYDLDNIITVAATTESDLLASFSNYGPINVDLGAPGTAVPSTFLSGDYVWGANGWYAWNSNGATYAWGNGTSMAAPHVTGVVGLLWSVHPEWTYQQVRAQVIGTARTVPALAGKTVSGGVLNAAAALGVSVPPPPAPPTAPGTPTLTKNGGGQVQIAWSDNSSNESGFEVQREKKSGASWGDPQIVANVGAGVTQTIDVPGAGTFRYRIRAYNASGASSWSAWTQIKN